MFTPPCSLPLSLKRSSPRAFLQPRVARANEQINQSRAAKRSRKEKGEEKGEEGEGTGSADETAGDVQSGDPDTGTIGKRSASPR